MALVLVLLVPWVLVAAVWFRSRSPQASLGLGAAAVTPLRSDKHLCKPGPWGRIEYYDIITQPPDEFISPSFYTEAPSQWVLKGYSKAALVELLISAELTLEQRGAIEACAEFSPAANQCVVKPGSELVIGLRPTARARIYAALGKFAENPGQRDPFIFRPEKINGWLDNGGLAQSTVALVKGLLYPRGGSLLLSDSGLIMRELSNAEERVRLLKVLFRRESAFPRLIVTPDSDINALTAYWGKGGRAVAIKPLLQALPHNPEGIAVNIALLLPHFARERLYTFPLPVSQQQGGATHDCHWSALNFFNESPEERFSRPEVVHATIDNDYYPVPGSPTFGDLVLFTAPEYGIVHSAVYVASDILFTKGGPSFTSPWLLMTQDEVLAAFPAYEKLDVSYHRLKKL